MPNQNRKQQTRQSNPQQTNNKFWNFRNSVDDGGQNVGVLELYGLISSTTWWGDEVTPKQFRQELKALGEVDELNVHICSDGGDVFAGTAIYSIIKQYKKPVNVYIEGLAASIATVIAMAADNIYISSVGMMMVHNAMAGIMGYFNANELAQIAGELEKIREPIIAAYQSKTGLSRDEIIELLDGEDNQGTWLTADEAIENGFADEYIPAENDNIDAIACIMPGVYSFKNQRLDLTKYPNAPKLGVKNKYNERTGNNMAKSSRGKKFRAAIFEADCPECGRVFSFDENATGEYVEITCPECSALLGYDTGEEEVIEVIEEGAEAENNNRRKDKRRNTAKNKSKKRARRKANRNRSIKNEVTNVTCPECGYEFNDEVADDVIVVKEDCSECGAEFPWSVETESVVTEIATESGIDPNLDDTQNKNGGNYNAGMISERLRISELDKILEAAPQFANIINKAKINGLSADETRARVFNAMAHSKKNQKPNNQHLLNMYTDAAAVAPFGNAVSPSLQDADTQNRIDRINAKRGHKKSGGN